ncbi:serine protease, S1-C subfamily, contains C-terminal PDZ domain [Paenibacillaceae bacterium GAS479]|nr:serine protease, S1-C subfamily, contains C-terminal PDZ domain [Paenibacillaceae bacterium GAS479]
MDDRKGRYNEFWSGKEEGNDQDRQKESSYLSDEEAAHQEQDVRGYQGQENSSYYYSYGPFKQGQPGESGRDLREGRPAEERSYERPSDSVQQRDVMVTPPRQLRPFVPAASAGKGEWQGNGGGTGGKKKRGSGLRTAAVSFLAGVIAVGGLMWKADTDNWFTGDTPVQVLSGSNNNVPAASKAPSAQDLTRPMNIPEISKQASPAVVLITTYTSANSGGGGLNEDPFFRQFFGDQFGGQGGQGGQGGEGGQGGQGNGGGQLQETGIGSGFFFEKDGYILTNQHVINGAEEIKIKVQGYSKDLTAKVLGSSKDLDLAVLKVEQVDGKEFPTLPLGDSDSVEIGEWLVAIGNPNGFDHTVTAGVLSARDRQIQVGDETGAPRTYKNLLQTDASINPGNSGGPLLNTKGEVIGINTAISADSEGIGFAIATSTIKEVLEQLKSNQNVTVPTPFIGATLSDITEEMQQNLGLPNTEGAIVRDTTFNSPAYKAGLTQYDVITGLDGKEYATKEELIAEIRSKKIGDKVVLDVIRKGDKIKVTVEVGDGSKFDIQ